MTNYTNLLNLTKVFLEQDEKLTAKYTKAESKRIRTTLGDIKKLITLAIAELVEKDKQ